jgi:hypothetical protein
LKTIKIARIGGEFLNSEKQVSDYINPYTGKPSNTWRKFKKAKKLFDSLDFKNISRQEGGYLPEYKMTKSQMKAEIAYQFEDGYKPFLYLFSFEIPLDIWVNRKRYAKKSGYDDVMEYITDFTNYSWVTETEREISIPKKVLNKYTLISA